ncbi:COP9 signalosome complex subunit 7a [Pelomyxa schiedti]|nr:COP9 signalosome complex subunit 7a [Pelomyxa schiedti]
MSSNISSCGTVNNNNSLGDSGGSCGDLSLSHFVVAVSRLSPSDPDFQAVIAKVVEDALDDPNLFVFSELLALPQIKSAPLVLQEKLKLFAFKTFKDYKADDTYGALTQNQMTKLRQLTLISLAEKRRVIPYAELLQALGLSDTRQLADIVMTSIYQGIIAAKMDQAAANLEVHYAIGRDLAPTASTSSDVEGTSGSSILDLSAIRATLSQWVDASDKLLATIDERTNMIQSTASQVLIRTECFQSQLKTAHEFVRQEIDAGILQCDEPSRPQQVHPSLEGFFMGGRGFGQLSPSEMHRGPNPKRYKSTRRGNHYYPW